MEVGILPKRSETSTNVLYPLDKKSRASTLFQKVQGAMRNVPNFGDTCKAILDAVMDEMDGEKLFSDAEGSGLRRFGHLRSLWKE